MKCEYDPVAGDTMTSDDWELEVWLLDAGERVERKGLADSSLSPQEHLIRELWLFDMETRNGGVSQYFCNHGRKQWTKLVSCALPQVPSLRVVISAVEKVIANKRDAYRATLKVEPVLEDLYEAHQLKIKRELRKLAPNL